MNFKRIFLVKCLLLLLPSVKCSVPNWIYVAVNETALLSITAGRSVYEAVWVKDRTKLLQMKNRSVKYYVNREQCRCKILPNGTLQIQQVAKEDSGKYKVTVFQQDGKLVAEEHKMVIVQEPVPQPILSADCRNKTIFVKCEVNQKAKDDTFTIELTQDKIKETQTNVTKLEMRVQNAGTFRCVVKNQVSEKMTEKGMKCSGHLDFYLILSIAGGAIFFVAFMILLIYCIRKKKAEGLEDNDEERTMRVQVKEEEVNSKMVMRELPQVPCNPTMKQLQAQQRPLPQPQAQQQVLPPQPRPRTQKQTPNRPRERP